MKKFMFMLMMLFCGNTFGQNIEDPDYYMWMMMFNDPVAAFYEPTPMPNPQPMPNPIPMPDPISTPTAPKLSQTECDALRGVIVLTDFAIEAQKVITQTAMTNWQNKSNQTTNAYAALMQSYMVIPYDEQNTNQLRLQWQALTIQVTQALEEWNNAKTMLSMFQMLRSEYQKQLEDGGCGHY